MDTITSYEDQILETITAGQEPVVEYVKKAVELVEGYLPEDRPSLPFADQLPSAAEIVDTQFAFAKRLLDAQHDFAKAIVNAVAPAAPAKKVVKSAPKAAAAA
jgi:hypothetical protein